MNSAIFIVFISQVTIKHFKEHFLNDFIKLLLIIKV